jgi:hypothetical protein
MGVLLWPASRHFSSSSGRRSNAPRTPGIGDYAGRARFAPHDVNDLCPQLAQAVGKAVHLQLAGIARDDEPFTGQRLYRECPGTAILAGYWVPEQDLEFLD